VSLAFYRCGDEPLHHHTSQSALQISHGPHWRVRGRVKLRVLLGACIIDSNLNENGVEHREQEQDGDLDSRKRPCSRPGPRSSARKIPTPGDENGMLKKKGIVFTVVHKPSCSTWYPSTTASFQYRANITSRCNSPCRTS
jgi:hypothetical protein